MRIGSIKMKRHLATVGLVFLVTLLTWHLGLMPAQGGNVNPSGGGGGGGGTGCNTTGTAILKGDGSGGCANALSGTDYAPATSGTAILKGNGSGAFANAAAGTDYQAPIAGNTLGANNFATSINSSGTLSGAQPAFTNISGVAQVAQGGTAGTTQATARSGIGAAASGANSDITSLSGLTTPLTTGQGGTGTNYGSTGVKIQLTNAAGGTTTNDLYTTDSSGNAVNITAGTASGALGICDSGCSTSGTGTFYTGPGNHTCNFDGSVTRGDFVNISATTNGDCTDVGASQLPGFQTIGFVNQATASGAGAYTVYFYGPGVLGAGLPASGAACNLLTDNGATWVSLTPGGDLICGGSLGQFKIAGIDSIAFTGTHVSGSTSNGFWCTNGSGNYVACAAATDPATTPGDMLALQTAGTPNTYARVAAGALGTVLSGMGATSTPANQVNEAPILINYNIDGTINNSTNRYRVCPSTMRYLPGAAAGVSASPFYIIPASRASANTAPSQGDIYSIQDGGVTEITLYNPTSGSPTFGTPGCSANFDGTQGGSAFARGAGPSTTVNTPSGAATTDAGLVVCTTLSTAGSWSPAPAGTTLVPGGAFTGTGISTSVFEINPIGSTTSETCTYTATATSGAAFYTFKGTPTSGEIVDAIAATRVVNQTTAQFPGITPTVAGDFFINVFASGISSGALSANPFPFTLGQTSNGQGVEYYWLGSSLSATGATTATTTSGTQYDISIGLLAAGGTGTAQACTFCTAGDSTRLVGPTTGTNGADLSVVVEGAK